MYLDGNAGEQWIYRGANAECGPFDTVHDTTKIDASVAADWQFRFTIFDANGQKVISYLMQNVRWHAQVDTRFWIQLSVQQTLQIEDLEGDELYYELFAEKVGDETIRHPLAGNTIQLRNLIQWE